GDNSSRETTTATSRAVAFNALFDTTRTDKTAPLLAVKARLGATTTPTRDRMKSRRHDKDTAFEEICVFRGARDYQQVRDKAYAYIHRTPLLRSAHLLCPAYLLHFWLK